MGSLVSCLSDPCQSGNGSPPPQARRRSSTSSRGRGGGGGGRDSAKASVTIDEEALAAAAALVLGQRGGGAFERSASVRYAAKRHGQGPPLPRSCSTRPRSLADPELQPQQLLAKDLNTKDLETSVIVLVHGGGFGAWCWYKTISLLEDSGFRVNAIDLTGSGIHSYDTNKICSLSEYAEPLTSYLEGLGDAEKVILVAHDLGGACVSYAMEMFPTKVAKAVFLCAAMLTNGNSALDMFQQQMDTNGTLQKAQAFVYSNGKDRPPTAINVDRALLRDLLFNQSPSKDVSLASVSMRPIPFAPVLEKLVLTAENYGSVRRFYVETTEDNAIPLPLQQSMCGANPPEKVLRLKGADHAPFFSKPQALHKTLVEIAAMPPVGAS
ncbi:putative methylesterase 11, chloroplastic [Zea mays]|uniref:AB hydrolase-1 domain-containing protein n=1 Tax=Zea mays TaxID=4577 RepID=A0A804QGV7_MAIZE|nr:putative methylesterase 11, chloroplastic [Zea mays]|eukprot:XP_008653330.1 putative methylesterase 11, chloroplastic [Zea mays]